MAHVPHYAEKVAQAFVEGREAKSPLSLIGGDFRYTEKGRRLTTDGSELLSYDWWTVAKRGCRYSKDCIRVTKNRYQTGNWKSGKPKYSPTTDGHIQSARDALARAGYVRLEGIIDEKWDHYMQF